MGGSSSNRQGGGTLEGGKGTLFVVGTREGKLALARYEGGACAHTRAHTHTSAHTHWALCACLGWQKQCTYVVCLPVYMPTCPRYTEYVRSSATLPHTHTPTCTQRVHPPMLALLPPCTHTHTHTHTHTNRGRHHAFTMPRCHHAHGMDSGLYMSGTCSRHACEHHAPVHLPHASLHLYTCSMPACTCTPAPCQLAPVHLPHASLHLSAPCHHALVSPMPAFTLCSQPRLCMLRMLHSWGACIPHV